MQTQLQNGVHFGTVFAFVLGQHVDVGSVQYQRFFANDVNAVLQSKLHVRGMQVVG